MTVEDALIAKYDRDGWPLQLVCMIARNPHRPIHSVIREWMTVDPED